jgi:hypothetical protein
MSKNAKYSKVDFVKFAMSTVADDSSDKDKAKEYLSSQGLDVDFIVSEGLKRIKRMQMQIQVQKTKDEMQSAEAEKQKAIDWVEELLSHTDFSFNEFVKKEEMIMNFRNIEELNTEDIKNILVKHFTLKFLDEKKNKSNGI